MTHDPEPYDEKIECELSFVPDEEEYYAEEGEEPEEELFEREETEREENAAGPVSIAFIPFVDPRPAVAGPREMRKAIERLHYRAAEDVVHQCHNAFLSKGFETGHDFERLSVVLNMEAVPTIVTLLAADKLRNAGWEIEVTPHASQITMSPGENI